MARITNKARWTPTPRKPEAKHEDGSFRVQLWGGRFHGLMLRIFPGYWDDEVLIGDELYRIHIWPNDDEGNHCVSYIHSSLPTPKETARAG